jgi:hypothetical protein
MIGQSQPRPASASASAEVTGPAASDPPLYQGRSTSDAARRPSQAMPARSEVSVSDFTGCCGYCGSDPISASQRARRRVRSSLDPYLAKS